MRTTGPMAGAPLGHAIRSRGRVEQREPGCPELLIETEHSPDAQLAHHDDARAVHETQPTHFSLTWVLGRYMDFL